MFHYAQAHLTQHQAIAEFAYLLRLAIGLGLLAERAVSLICRTLEVATCDILELAPDGASLRLLASSEPTPAPGTLVPIPPNSQADVTLRSPRPVVVPDIRTETRFERPLLPDRTGVTGAVSVAIPGREVPFGILAVATATSRRFTLDEIAFIATMAELAGVAVDLRRAQQIIHHQRTLLNTVGEAVIAAGLDGRIISWNRAAELLYGWRVEEVLGHPLAGILGLQELDELAAHALDGLCGGRRWSGEIWVRARSPNPVLVHVVCAPLHDAMGALVGTISVHTEIGARRSIEHTLRETQVRLEQQVTARTEELLRTNVRLQDEIAKQQELAAELAEVRRVLHQNREAERLRLAQDLHDGPLQDLAAINLELSLFAGGLEHEEQVAHLHALRARQERAAAQLRRLTQELRPPILAHFGLSQAMQSYVEKTPEPHPKPAFDWSLSEDGAALPEMTKLALFRIFQQALQNIYQYAQADHVKVRLWANQGRVHLEVEDDGRGFLIPEHWVGLAREGHLGLVRMNDRAEALGGELEINSAPGRGTLVHVSVPVRVQAPAEAAPANPRTEA